MFLTRGVSHLLTPTFSRKKSEFVSFKKQTNNKKNLVKSIGVGICLKNTFSRCQPQQKYNYIVANHISTELVQIIVVIVDIIIHINDQG